MRKEEFIKIRESMQLTRQQLAEELQLTRQTIFNYENDKYPISKCVEKAIKYLSLERKK
jgi:DNA-binding XRE family transcriptional regulator